MIFSSKVKALRKERSILQRDIAEALSIDTPMYSRFERGERRMREEHVRRLANFYKIDPEPLLKLWLAEKVYSVIENSDSPREILRIVEEALPDYGK